MTAIKKRLFIFVCDIGAAQIIRTVFSKLSAKFAISLCVSQSATNYFQNYPNIPHKVTKTSDEALVQLKTIQPELVLLGTSNQNQIEPHIIKAARQLKIKTVAFVDQWQNYQVRFKQFNKFVLPDKIILPDNNAIQEFKKEVGDHGDLACGGQPYLRSLTLRPSARKVKKQQAKTLFISEPISSTLNRQQIQQIYGYDEKVTFFAILKVLRHLRAKQTLSVKLHPKENKLNRTKSAYHCRYNSFSHQQLMQYDLVIGMASTVLLEAYILGLNVYVFQPQASSQFDHCMLSRYGYLRRCTTSRDLLLSIRQRVRKNRRLDFLKIRDDRFISTIS
ncbi:hypothetical protein AN214_00833 [Pseudoalteromonas sp. P1-9]|uniref:hypothetical protein n=1 Tax=Pseudoalteromonas sp. P1-9 TaxID=1710354 RepID=UPI0006D5F32A|nr:hypothetical protein [Pseudoalteromonas sp. P1-9]KPV97328.1 hypothetical protein AN214_00833 [Pseudoalteromonas sp. P1-9]